MPFVVQRDHYILSPYFDWFSFLVSPSWRHPAKDLAGIMANWPTSPAGRSQNVYVADASLFPESLGNPPILTIVAMAKRIGRLLTAAVPSGQQAAAA
jgi:GMC oxidoreductase